MLDKWLQIKINQADSKECFDIDDLGSDISKSEIIYIGRIKFKKVIGAEGAAELIIDYTRYSTLRENQCVSITLITTIRNWGVFYPEKIEESLYEKQVKEIESEDEKIIKQILSTFKFRIILNLVVYDKLKYMAVISISERKIEKQKEIVILLLVRAPAFYADITKGVLKNPRIEKR